MPNTPPVREWPAVRVMRTVLRANAALRDAHEAILNPLGFTLTDFDMIAALGNTEGLRMTELARHMMTSPSNVTRVCKGLEAKGLVTRARSASSDREVLARLTPKGDA